MYALSNNSKSFQFIIEKAKGSWIWDKSGKIYLDAFSSFSSANFGHCHPHLFRKLIQQTKKLSVFSRTSTSDVLIELCGEMSNLYSSSIKTNQLKVVPMNSGVEAGETAVKLARKWGYLKKNIPEGQANVVFANGNYWGRTISAISTSDYSYQKHFFPSTPGFLKVPYNNISALRDLLVSQSHTICAIFLEPIQGEGGINIPSSDYFKKVSELCKQYNVLLICDEIQTGMGRTGTDLCIQSYGIQADMVLLGKSLGGGFLPFSTCMVRSDVADLFIPGEHSSTFGGFPLGARMALESLRLLHCNKTGLLKTSFRRGREIELQLHSLSKKFPQYITSFRGKGMLWGIELSPLLSSWNMVEHLTKHQIVTREANNNVVRICPPLTSSDTEMTFLFNQLEKGFATL